MKQLTLILALKDRHEETINWIKNNIYDEYDYLVVDGSIKNFNQKIFLEHKFKNLNIIDVKDLNVKFFIKTSFCIKKSKTQFVLAIDNDDYINPKI